MARAALGGRRPGHARWLAVLEAIQGRVKPVLEARRKLTILHDPS
jgi:hypothetical protein